MFKKITALILVFVLVVGVVPSAKAATETIVDTGDVTIEGTNGFGNLLAQEITKNQQESETESKDYLGGYSITDLEIVNNVATVTYDSLEEAILVVALHTEDGMQLITSATVTVTSDATEAVVTFAGEMPEYFLASAYLLDQYDYSPLCASYDTPIYTREMEELLASTVDDYDPEKVLNLDDDETTNFAVYADSTIVIEPVEGKNIVASIDNENAAYVIKNADEQMLSLKNGDVFAYTYGENELLIVKIGSIVVNGTTVTIIGAELEMSEAFEAVKIDGIGETEDIVVDDSAAGEGISYVGLVEEDGVNNPNSVEGGDTTTLKHKFEIKIKSKADDGHTSASLAVSGSLDLALDVSVKYYISTSQKYVEFKLSPHLTFSLGVQESLTLSEELGYLAVSPVPGVYVGFEPELQLKLDCKTDFKATLKSVIGFKYDTASGVQNISKKPEFDIGIDVEGTIFLGIDFCPQVAIVSDKLSEIEVNMLVGFELEAKASGKAFEAYKKNADEYHECQECIAIDVRVKAKIGGTLKFLNQDWLSVSITIGEWTHKLGEMYYSLDKDEFGIGKCPNRIFRVTVLVKDKEYHPIPGETVTVSNLEEALTTDENGLVVFYTPEDEIVVRAEKDGYFSAERVTINKARKIVLCLIYQINSGDNGSSGGDDPKPGNPFEGIDFGGIADRGNEMYSGTCGDNLTWTLYENGLLSINGTGAMTSFSAPSDAPWAPYLQSIKSVKIENGVTTVGDYAFTNSEWLTNVTIPGSITTIGCEAFSCSGLISVEIPDSVTIIGSSAFSECDNLSRVKILDSVVTIFDWAFIGCDNLSSVEFGDSVTTIGNGVFFGCKGLSSVEIPNSVTSIGAWAFSYCNILTCVTFRGDAPSISGTMFHDVVATAYYPADNPTWTSEVMQNYGGTITWVPYTPSEGSSIIGELTQISAQKLAMELEAVYGGEYDTEITEEATIKTASFNDLVPNEQYVMLAMVSVEGTDPLAAENLLGIAQGTADEDGTLSFRYIQRTPYDVSYVVVCGASNKNLSDAEITFPEMVEDGQHHAVEPTVVYDGQTLVEGQDYIMIGTVDYTEPGVYTCWIRGICDYTGQMECTYTVAEHEHNFTNYVSDGNATCTEDGTKTARCDHCDATDTIPDADSALDHDMGSWETTVPVTCTENGEEERNCSRCDHSESRVVEAVGHRWDKGVVTREPTEDTEGELLYTCTACGATRTESIPVIGHEHRYEAVVTAPTCTERGYTTYTCKCGESYVADYVAALGHSFGDWSVIQEPTTTEEGLEERSCARCGHTEQRTIDKLENPFNDVAPGSFYYEPVMWAIENGITNGTSDTTFSPNAQCMRAQVVTFLWRAAGSPEPTKKDNPFVDVKPIDFYYKAVLWAVENGITSGMDATHFGPTAYCNRAQVVTFLYRAMGSPELESMDNPFADVQAGAFYERAVLWAVENGITNGLSATAFGPNSICNRAQIVTFLYRAFVD